MTCNVCREEGHVATKCYKKGNCFNCRQPGHVSRDCPDRSYGRGGWGQPSKGVSLVSEPDGAAGGGAAGGGSPAVEAHRTEPVSVVGVGPLGQTFSSPAPPSSGGGGSLDGGVAPVSVPDSELSLSVCGYMNTSLQPEGKNLTSNGLSLVSIHYFTPKVETSILYTVCCQLASS